MDELDDLTRIMERNPRLGPPAGFTARVMARLPGMEAAVPWLSLPWLFRAQALPTGQTFGFRRPAAKAECAFYLFLTGFSHLILAVVLFWGMKDLSGDVAGSSWIRLQPYIVSFLSGWLFISGVALWRGHRAGLAAARIAIVIYLEIVIINGALPLVKFGSQWFLLPFWVLTASGMIIGGSLALALRGGLSRKTMKIGTIARLET